MGHKFIIEENLENAVKKKDSLRASILRMLLAAIKNKEIEKIRPLREDGFFAIVKTSTKQHTESIGNYKKVNRLELAEKKEIKLEILKEFLPTWFPEQEFAIKIEEAARDVEAKNQKNMGRAIKSLLEKFPGRINGKVLNGSVLKRLSSNG